MRTLYIFWYFNCLQLFDAVNGCSGSAFYVFYFPMDFYINGNFRGFNLDFSGTYHTTEAALIKG